MLVLDTSALLKRYIDEDGTSLVLDLMERDTEWVASAIARTETELAVCRISLQPDIAVIVQGRVRSDWERFLVVPLDSACLRDATVIGCEQRVRTLDAIHLAAARRLPGAPRFVTFDRRLATAARAIGMAVVDGTAASARSRRRGRRPEA
jgi:predicted nucleic acid-binding protein